MALIQCPECNKEISEKAESCPNCGYVLVKNVLPQMRISPLSEKETNPILGLVFILCGVVAIIGGIFTLAIIIGILPILGGAGMIGAGAMHLSGKQNGKCPYCENKVVVKASAATYKCPHCNKICTKKENSLETIE